MGLSCPHPGRSWRSIAMLARTRRDGRSTCFYLLYEQEIGMHKKQKSSLSVVPARFAAAIGLTFMVAACSSQAGPVNTPLTTGTANALSTSAAVTKAPGTSGDAAGSYASMAATAGAAPSSPAVAPSTASRTSTVTSSDTAASVSASASSTRAVASSSVARIPTSASHAAPADITVCPRTSTCVELAHTSLSGGIELDVESRDGQTTVVTEHVSNQLVDQKTYRNFGAQANLECAVAHGTAVCSLSGVPGAHISFAAIFSVTPEAIHTLSTDLFGEGDFYLTALDEDDLLLTTVKVFTDGGLSPALAPTAWKTWNVTDKSVSLSGCGRPSTDRSAARPTALLRGPCSGVVASSASPTAPPPGGAPTTLVAAPDADSGKDPAIDGPVSAGTPADLSNYQTSPSQIVATFKSPSGNINCTMYVDYPTFGNKAICSIVTHQYRSLPGSSGGSCGAGDSVEVSSAQGARSPAVCVVGHLGTGLAELPSGQSLTFGGITCLSTDSGVKCIGSDGRGFVISQREIALYR